MNYSILKVKQINFEEPDVVRHRINFDNLTPLYPEDQLNMEINDPTVKDTKI